jgi:hypothetical protein
VSVSHGVSVSVVMGLFSCVFVHGWRSTQLAPLVKVLFRMDFFLDIFSVLSFPGGDET